MCSLVSVVVVVSVSLMIFLYPNIDSDSSFCATSMFVKRHSYKRLRMLLRIDCRNSPSTASLMNCLSLFLGGLPFRCLMGFDFATVVLRCVRTTLREKTCVGICIFIDSHRCMDGQIVKVFLFLISISTPIFLLQLKLSHFNSNQHS